MEETIHDLPTSTVLLDDCNSSQVIFNNVEKFYVPGRDITCCYTITEHFLPHRKDWIGIFRVGWKTTREYYTFMWVTLPVDLNSETAKQQEVEFKAYYLPKDDEYYQFCYVDQDDMVRGASIPFQFRREIEEDILVVTTQGEVEKIEQQNKELRRENEELQDNFVNLCNENADIQAELKKKQEEIETLEKINQKLEQKLTSQNHSWEREVLQLKKEAQKLSSENEDMGNTVDQLQIQLQKKEQEMEKQQKSLEKMKQEATAASRHFSQLSRRLEEEKDMTNDLRREKMNLLREQDALRTTIKKLEHSASLGSRVSSYLSPSVDKSSGFGYRTPFSGIQESSAASLFSKKCSTCESDFADESFDHTLEQQHKETLQLVCTICGEIFPGKEKQVFEDHLFCHSLYS
ncbi:calcium-binding and coiled-coil domain-containing protein 2 isoform X1 [Erinaceus europaeus]|uniref:Calcium-binding and coiled-coil domain-containing protein 2 n=1 Tax=Erinaceus europaeus TaxID=9365 RepID=A0ABM3YEZ0_ERIEU|nr:calcium-binding and coiled-coil domain-containing protein 2 isoform X1 [Erinaceus europaeus]